MDVAGLFGLIVDPTSVGNQIVKSINLSRDGIHDVPLVLSIQTRFTREEQTVVQAFQKFFGTRISDYMIVVFTGVGEIKYGDFDVLISCVFPEHLMVIVCDLLQICYPMTYFYPSFSVSSQTN